MIYKTLSTGLIILVLAIYIIAKKNVDIDGQYERFTGNTLDIHSANLDISKQANGRYSVTGIATWMGDPAIGNVNMAELEGTFPLVDNAIRYDLDGCQLLITFTDGSLLVTEDKQTCGGLNVSFNGFYKKAVNDL